MSGPKQWQRTRQRLPAAFAALAMVALINAAGAAISQRAAPAPPARTAEPSPAATPTPATPSPHRTHPPPLPTIALTDRPIVRDRARRFLTAFANFDVGRNGSRVRALLRATATPRLARALRAHPPRPSGAGYPPAGHVNRLRAFRHAGGWQATAELRGPGVRRRVAITLTETPDGPRANTVLP